MAFNSTMVPLGMTIGPMIMGFFFGVTNLSIVFLVAAGIALIIPLMTLVIGKNKLAAGE